MSWFLQPLESTINRILAKYQPTARRHLLRDYGGSPAAVDVTPKRKSLVERYVPVIEAAGGSVTPEQMSVFLRQPVTSVRVNLCRLVAKGHLRIQWVGDVRRYRI